MRANLAKEGCILSSFKKSIFSLSFILESIKYHKSSCVIMTYECFDINNIFFCLFMCFYQGFFFSFDSYNSTYMDILKTLVEYIYMQ